MSFISKYGEIVANGKKYDTVLSFARDIGVSKQRVYQCLKSGKSFEEIFLIHSISNGNNDHSIAYKGKIYSSIKSCSEENDIEYNFLCNCVKTSNRLGLALEQVIKDKSESKTAFQFTYDGNQYSSIKDCAVKKDISYDSLRACAKRSKHIGVSPEQLVADKANKKGKQIVVFNKLYRSLSSCSNELEIPYSTLRKCFNMSQHLNTPIEVLLKKEGYTNNEDSATYQEFDKAA